MKIYLSGPMTGLPGLNADAFKALERLLRSLGHEVVNPHSLNSRGSGWELCMRGDLLALLLCDAVFVMEGSDKSRGATLETTVAAAVGIPLLRVSDFVSNWMGKP